MFDKMTVRGLLALGLLLAVSAEVRGQEITYDPISEYSNVNNPNGPWSYGWLNNSQFQLFVSNGPQGGGTAQIGMVHSKFRGFSIPWYG